MISIIIPVYNEEENLNEFHEKLICALIKIEDNCEIIYVNDGSTDGSYRKICKIAENDKNVRLLNHNRNHGQTMALKTGFDNSKGDLIVFIDSDLQNDPEDIPSLIKKIQEGYDVVSGWRKNRQDPITKVWPSKIANKIICWILGVDLHDIGCSLKAYRRNVLQNIDFYGEIHRILPVYANNNGAKITEICVKHHPRKAGKTKYGINRVFKLSLDMITAYYAAKYSRKPMYFFGYIGLFFFLSGVVLLIFTVTRAVFYTAVWVSPVLFIAIMLFLVGSQVLLMGILAEVLMKVYYQGGCNKSSDIIQKTHPETD